jgi:putative PIN family toxin of toxin-antitoxin system
VKIVIDTNILVSALISRSAPPHQIFEAWKRDTFELCSCEEQLIELRRVLNYPKLKPYLNADDAALMVDELTLRAQLVRPRIVSFSQDPDDNVIIGCALAASADFLVTGDKRDILMLGTIETLRCVTARDLLNKLGSPILRQ